ncbi:methyltransferase [Leptolyngbya sp. KIOST-1]|uniref:methyltransferase n=1 Tax=Leptolyngbya sp. KIOST-1 TaxID=1229172 RepID=UPI0006909322|nr:methyltransferase [Leptolyngbya sp. KIOST-1]
MVWGLLFLPLLVARPILVVGLAIANRGSLALPQPIALGLGLALLIPALYTLWSVARYFGIPRAIGGDHFRSHYRTMPLVQQGAFAWSGNAMYVFAFLGLWAIALLIGSQAALAVALFQHAYVWVHFYCTEAPDMDLLYGQD